MDLNAVNNCTTTSSDKFAYFDLAIYYLYRLTLGNGLDEVSGE